MPDEYSRATKMAKVVFFCPSNCEHSRLRWGRPMKYPKEKLIMHKTKAIPAMPTSIATDASEFSWILQVAMPAMMYSVKDHMIRDSSLSWVMYRRIAGKKYRTILARSNGRKTTDIMEEAT